MPDCSMCDYSSSTLGGRCCMDTDSDTPTPLLIRQVKIEKTFNESEVHQMILTAVAKSESKCDALKQELLNLSLENNELRQQAKGGE